ncbi:hypothetical protein [Anaerosporobacter faecicola]|nr:hypothetical protein [Anaerosporobacter faecicola]
MNIYDSKKEEFHKIRLLLFKAVGEVLLIICILVGAGYGLGKLFG